MRASGFLLWSGGYGPCNIIYYVHTLIHTHTYTYILYICIYIYTYIVWSSPDIVNYINTIIYRHPTIIYLFGSIVKFVPFICSFEITKPARAKLADVKRTWSSPVELWGVKDEVGEVARPGRGVWSWRWRCIRWRWRFNILCFIFGLGKTNVSGRKQKANMEKPAVCCNICGLIFLRFWND